MPILSTIGARRPEQIALRAGIYLLLLLGALGIVYPLLVVLGQTFSDRFDLRENAVVPRYLRSRNDLALKRVFSSTARLDLLASRHRRNQWTSPAAMRSDADFYESRPGFLEALGYPQESWEAVLADFSAFKSTVDPANLVARAFRIEDYYRPFLRDSFARQADQFIAERAQGRPDPEWFQRYAPDADRRQEALADREELARILMNHELRGFYRSVYHVELIQPGNLTVPFWRPAPLPKERMWIRFKGTLPPGQLMIVPSDTYWHAFLKTRYREIGELNTAWGTDHERFYSLRLALTAPEDPRIRDDWDLFIVTRWPRRLLEVPPEFAPAWRAFVSGRLNARAREMGMPPSWALEEAAQLSGTDLTAWEQLELPRRMPENDDLMRYWCEFTASGQIPAVKLILDAPELNFRRFLQRKYGDVAGLNQSWGTAFSRFKDVSLPHVLADYLPVRNEPGRLRWSFATESYRRVIEYLFGKGRAVWNTFVLVVLSLISALTINPMAAYSLSRFPMKSSHRVLIFFLVTIAFPVEVAMIPNFLLLRDLGLLNTFAALVLPGMANGFSIFLLKGFFDSLPAELYEAGEMDGASEFQIFRIVALPLLKPILAYIGLGAFVAAYGGFMWAMIICTDPEMWTLMVWIYDFQMFRPGNNYILAATVLVSIPPLLVFLIANRIIMKGIVIPTMA